MYKKIAISFLAIVLIFNFTMKDYTDAAVASKAATLTAKKILKEVVQEASIETAVNFALMEAMQIAGDYEAKEGYKIVCPSGGSTCDKPVQIKQTLTESDKTAIKAQSSIELDKLISPDGKGFSKFQSFLDWFLPIWLITFAVTALTYAMDDGFRSMLNEAGYNTLVALGIITPLTTNDIVPLNEVNKPPRTVETGNQTNELDTAVKASTSTWNMAQVNVNYSPQNVLMETRFDMDMGTVNMGTWSLNNYTLSINNKRHFIWTAGSITLENAIYSTSAAVYRINDGNPVNLTLNGNYATQRIYTLPASINIQTEKTNAILTRLPYEINGKWYTDILYNTVDGKKVEIQFTHDAKPYFGTAITTIKAEASHNQGGHSIRLTSYPNIEPKKKILTPFEEYPPGEMDMVANSAYISEDAQKIALVPPAAFPYQEETTGETVYRTPNPTGDGFTFQKEDGTIVPEENIVPGETPTITPNPEGTPQYTPAPTPSNPAPAPTPLTPGEVSQPTPDGKAPPPPPAEEEPPLEPFPEGSKCDAKLQFPIFSPLKEQFSTSFPFSIPWDIGRAIEAGFGDIGQTKPEFSYDFELLGEVYPISITTPKLFDDWKPFTDSLLIFIFDVSIMFGIYRFVKGGGS